MSRDAEKAQDAQDAQSILQCGWRQGSVFDPRVNSVLSLPFDLGDGELLMICTQSCSVVSERFKADPYVEVMAVTPLKRFKNRAPEAIGKNRRKLHVQLEQPTPDVVALECDINRRTHISRKLLLSLQLNSVLAVGETGAMQVAAWISGNYNRIALPNALVDRMRTRLLSELERCLSEQKEGGTGPVHESVPYIYIDWQPRGEAAQIYHLNLLFIGDDRAAVEQLDRTLLVALDPFLDSEGINGIQILQYDCKLANETFLTDLDGYARLSEWDYLSNLVDVVDGPL